MPVPAPSRHVLVGEGAEPVFGGGDGVVAEELEGGERRVEGAVGKPADLDDGTVLKRKKGLRGIYVMICAAVNYCNLVAKV